VPYNLARAMVLTRANFRDCLALKNERLGEVLGSLELAGRLSRMAAARLIARRGRSRSPYGDKWERNGVGGLCRMRGTLGYVTPTDELTGIDARNLAERDHLLREARDSRAFDLS
jgi:hypothetical protein